LVEEGAEEDDDADESEDAGKAVGLDGHDEECACGWSAAWIMEERNVRALRWERFK
jgi:hypothetical protein